MAGLIASGIIKWTVSKLSSLVSAPIGSPSNEQSSALRDLRTLQRTMRRIQRTLGAADERSVRDESERLRLRELQQFAYDAQDAIDEYKFELLRRRMDDPNNHGEDSSSRKRKRKGDKKEPETEPDAVPVPDELAVQVTKILDRFKEITRAWNDLHLDEADGPMRDEEHDMRPLPTTPHIDEPTVIGRDEDKENITKLLLSVDTTNRGEVSILPIVGMGGVGKTTLSQLVYNDPRITKRFDLRGWTHVSGNFDLKTTMSRIIMAFTRKPCQVAEIDQLQYMLMEEVVGRKFLLVLDDMWDEKEDLWEALLSPMSTAQTGTVIVTTRHINVSTMIQTMPPYTMSCLPFEESWQLFKQTAFGHLNENTRIDFEDIGRKIIKKCGGLPLAVKAIGSALRFEENEDKWNDILDSEQWELPTREDTVLPALKLSYDRMPIDLRRCFIFFILFPKGHVFLKENVIYLWISLGILKRTSNRHLENVGSWYFDDLMQRTMVQHVLFDGGHGCFTIHDLVHDLAMFVSDEDILRIDTRYMRSLDVASDNIRYLSLTEILFFSFQKQQKMLLQVVLPSYQHYNSRRAMESFRHLRALDLSRSSMTTLPDSIGELKLLRYLSLFQTRIAKLPESICGLYNLKILDARTNVLGELPQDIQKLVSLQHLNLELWSPLCMPRGIGKLTKLQTLTRFSVGSGSWHCNIADLHHLVNIHGELSITGLGRVTNTDDAQTANLISKQHLQTLRLDWSGGFYSGECAHNLNQNYVPSRAELAEEVFESLKPHRNIEELEVAEYSGYRYPSWLGDSTFARLAKVTLWKQRCTFLPTLGQLPQLRKLVVICMEGVERIGQEFLGHDSMHRFPALKELEFENMPKWVEWSGVADCDFPLLRELKIKDCEELRIIPQKLSSCLNTLVVNKCEKLTKLPSCHNLTCLVLKGNLKEETLSCLHFPLLKILKVYMSRNVECIELDNRNLPMLEALAISGCRGMITVAGLCSLESLKLLIIKDCPQLQLPLQPLPRKLQRSSVINCPQLQEWAEWQQAQMAQEDQLQESDDTSYGQEALDALKDDSEDDFQVFSEENDEDDDIYDGMLSVGQSSRMANGDDDDSDDAV